MGDGLKSAGIEGDASGRTRRRVGAGLAAVLVAIVAIVVAQGGGSAGGPLNAIAKAAEMTQREPGGHATVDATVSSATTPEGITETGSLIFDDSERSQGTFTVRGHKTGREEQFEAIVDGTTTYARSDAFESLPEGKKWAEVDLSSATSGTSTSAAAGPKEGLEVLEGVEDAEKIGQEEVDGVPTTHYRGTFPTAEEVFGVKVEVSDEHADVWIDAQDRVRRMQVALKSAVSGVEGSASTTEISIDYGDFGRVPKIELPDPDEVFNATGEVESNLQSAAEGG